MRKKENTRCLIFKHVFVLAYCELNDDLRVALKVDCKVFSLNDSTCIEKVTG